MATRTGKSGDRSWNVAGDWEEGAVPVNGDTVIIPSGCNMLFNVDQSGFANGLALLTVNGVLHFAPDIVTYLKMNGNINCTGALYVCHRAVVSGWTLTTGKTYTYEKTTSVWIMDVEEDAVGNSYINAKDVKILNGSYITDSLSPNYKKDNATYLTEAQAKAFVEATASTFYYSLNDEKVYIHTSTGANPGGFIIVCVDAIQRPAAGSENRCTIMFNSTGIITASGTPIMRLGYGWYPELEYTTLSANAASGQAVIVLSDDLELQQGDTIAVGSGGEYGMPAESGKGVYTVQGYIADTKTVTLNTNLSTNRYAGDYVCIASRPIKITRLSGTTDICNSKIDNIKMIGTYVAMGLIITPSTDAPSGFFANHCTSGNKYLAYGVKNSVVRNSNRVGGASSLLLVGANCFVEKCISISGSTLTTATNIILKNCIQQNNSSPPRGISINSIFRNIQFFSYIYGPCKFINCVFHGNDEDTTTYAMINWIEPVTCVNCTFEDNTIGFFKYVEVKMHNCIFEGTNEVNSHTWSGRLSWQIIESFDHNQDAGNYKAWMRGGRIETEDIATGKLKFICESNDYPVFRDFKVYGKANKNIRYKAKASKDFGGGTVMMQIIDPAADPLIDSNNEPLAEAEMIDVADEDVTFSLTYTPTTTKELIFRVSAQNGSGNVHFNIIEYNKRYKTKLI